MAINRQRVAMRVLLLLVFVFNFITGLRRHDPTTLHIVAEIALAMACIYTAYFLLRDYRRFRA